MRAAKAIDRLGDELAESLAQIESICARYGFAARPTLILRHEHGPERSMLVTSDGSNPETTERLRQCVDFLFSSPDVRVTDVQVNH